MFFEHAHDWFKCIVFVTFLFRVFFGHIFVLLGKEICFNFSIYKWKPFYVSDIIGILSWNGSERFLIQETKTES